MSEQNNQAGGQEPIDVLRQALEVIGVGDSRSPQSDAANALVEAGIWTAAPAPVASPAALTDEQIVREWAEAGKTASDNHQQVVMTVRALLAAQPAEPAHADRQETPSRRQIGDVVSLNMGDESMPVATAKILAITFTADKVLYDLALPFDEGKFYPVMQRVDSILIGGAD